MCCEPSEIHRAMRACCGDYGSFVRRYLTAKEKQEMLEAYRQQLQNELKGVEERIKELERK